MSDIKRIVSCWFVTNKCSSSNVQQESLRSIFVYFHFLLLFVDSFVFTKRVVILYFFKSFIALLVSAIDDSPYYVFVALCIVVIVVWLIFKMAYFLRKARVRCAIANSKIFAKTFNIFIRGRFLYQWYHYNHNAKRYENVSNKGNLELMKNLALLLTALNQSDCSNCVMYIIIIIV
jgi:hypothetical protein